MRPTSQFVWPVLLGALLGSTAFPAVAGGTRLHSAGSGAGDGWQSRGDGIGASATWEAPGGDPFIRIRCDHGDPRIDLRITSPRLRGDLHQITLIADGVGMDYPVDRAGTSVTAKIALDAPILDRMLVTRAFAIAAGGRSLSTGVPGETLGRVVRACRSLHWPRDAASPPRPARIEPSDAGFAK